MAVASTVSSSNKNKKFQINGWFIGGAVVIVLAIAAALFIVNPARTSGANGGANAPATLIVQRGSIVGTVSGSGSIQPDQTLDVTFQTTGTVKHVLVKEGDYVKTGQTLATLDTSDLESKVANAQASLASAQAQLKQKMQGNGTPEQIASAQAQVNSAQAAYDKTAAGATPAERSAAQAAVSSAQAAYAAAQKDTDAGDSNLRSLKAALDQANVTLQQAQSAYDKVASSSQIGMLPQSKDLQNATIAYQKALADYNGQLVKSAPDSKSSIASALSSLQSAKKNLADLTVTPDQLASAQASLASAKSSLAQLTAAASDADVAIAQANVAQSEQSLKQAQLNLNHATLTAPFDGVITDLNIVPGSSANGTVMTLMNIDPMHVDLKLSENDVVKATVGQKVKLTNDAVPGWHADSTVSYIAPAGISSNGVVTYLVRVNLNANDPRIKVGMTLNVDLTTSEKDNVLVVPNAALLPQGSGHAVQVVNTDGTNQLVTVQTGITDGSQTEIVSGVNEGQKIVALPSSGGANGQAGLAPRSPF